MVAVAAGPLSRHLVQLELLRSLSQTRDMQGALFDILTIRRIRSYTAGEPVPVWNSNEARFVDDCDGETWVRKRELESGPNPMIAEAIGWLLARELDVPSPDAAWAEDAVDGVVWLSKFVPCIHWEPSHADRLADAAELGSILALDCILLNEDRHSRNVLVIPDAADTLMLRVKQIDTGTSWVAWPSSDHRRDDTPALDRLLPNVPVDACRPGAEATAERAGGMTRDRIDAIVQAALALFPDRREDAPVISELLFHRCRGAENLVRRYLDAIEGRSP